MIRLFLLKQIPYKQEGYNGYYYSQPVTAVPLAGITLVTIVSLKISKLHVCSPFPNDGRNGPIPQIILFMMIRFSFQNAKCTVQLFNKKQPDHLMRERHVR